MKTPHLSVVVAVAGLALALSSCCASCWKPSGSSEPSRGPRVVGYRQVEQVVANPDPKGGMAQVRMVQEPGYEEVAVRRRACGGSWAAHRRCVTWFRPDYWPCGTTGPETLAAASAQGSNGSPHIGLIPTMRRLAE